MGTANTNGLPAREGDVNESTISLALEVPEGKGRNAITCGYVCDLIFYFFCIITGQFFFKRSSEEEGTWI